MARDTGTEHQRFYSLSSRILGVVGVLMAATVVATGVVYRDSHIAAWGVALAVAVGVVVWAALVRQVLVLTPSTLVLHNMFHTTTLSLSAIDDIAMRQMLVVRVDGKRYASAAVGRSVRQLRRAGRAGGSGSARGFAGLMSPGLIGLGTSSPDGKGADAGAERTYDSLVEAKIRAQRDIARVTPGQDAVPAVVRTHAWPEIVLLAAASVATVVLLVAT